MIKSTAILMLKQSVPDVLVEIPLRPISIDWRGDENLMMHQACMIPGWHFFNRGFLLQRHLRAQVMNIVKKDPWCEALVIKMFNDEDIDWRNLETSVYEDPTTEYDYIPEMYDKLQQIKWFIKDTTERLNLHISN
ncbi:Uncharacterized protein OBRU01_16384, partial [Operophtera brumata]